MQKLSLVLLFAGISSAWWSPPIDLGIDGVDDINPQVCRVQVLWDLQISVVWESYLNGNADIFSRFGDGATWSDTFRVTNDICDDIYPRMAYDDVRDCFWCAWQRHGAVSDEIYISQGNETAGWSVPYQLTSDPLVDALPSVCVVNDTVWVVWERGENVNESTSFMNIYASYYDGTAWSAPHALTADTNLVNRNAKINLRYDHPLVVWEKSGDIYYCEYLTGSWQTPQSITSDLYEDANPEIASLAFDGTWVVWQTDRDGNYEIYTTAYDIFSVHYRMTFSDSADVTPSPIQFIAIGRQDRPPLTAFTSNRNGNDDIYTLFSLGYPGDTLIQVDASSGDDVLPVMTGNIFYLWVIWQSDRNGDWDIHGSYIYLDAIQEQVLSVSRPVPHISPNPSRTLCTVHSPVSINCIKIYDALGKLVRTSPVSNGGERIEISSRELTSGVYFVTISTADSEFTTKLIVTR